MEALQQTEDGKRRVAEAVTRIIDHAAKAHGDLIEQSGEVEKIDAPVEPEATPAEPPATSSEKPDDDMGDGAAKLVPFAHVETTVAVAQSSDLRGQKRQNVVEGSEEERPGKYMTVEETPDEKSGVGSASETGTTDAKCGTHTYEGLDTAPPSVRAAILGKADDPTMTDSTPIEDDMPMDNLERLAMLRSDGTDHDQNRDALRDIVKSMKVCKYDGIDLMQMALNATEPKAYAEETSRVGSPLPADDARWGKLSAQDRPADPQAKRQESGDKKRRKRAEVWEQVDWWAYRTATVRSDHGPRWEQVHRIITMDRDTNELIEDIQISHDSEPWEYRYELKCGGCRNTTTKFLYHPDEDVNNVDQSKPDIMEIYSPPQNYCRGEETGTKGRCRIRPHRHSE